MLWIWCYPLSKKEFFLKLAVPKKLGKSLKTICKKLRFYCICRLRRSNFIKKTLSLVFPKGWQNLRTPYTTQKLTMHKKWSFSLRISSVKETSDLVIFTEEILAQCYERIRHHINSLYKLKFPLVQISNNFTSLLCENQYAIIYQS